MNPWLKYGLIAGGAYLIFRDQVDPWLSNFFGSGSAAADSASAAAPAAPSASVLSTMALMDAASQTDAKRIAQGGRMSWDQWNFYYRIVRGIDAPAFERVFPGTNRGLLLSLDEWINATAAHGLAGLPVAWRRRAWGY